MRKIQLYLLSGAIMTSLLFGMSNKAYAREAEDLQQEEMVIHHVFEEDKESSMPIVVGKVVAREGDMMIVRSRDERDVDYLIDLSGVSLKNSNTTPQALSVGNTIEVYGKLQEILKP